jgi:hypothetical protein
MAVGEGVGAGSWVGAGDGGFSAAGGSVIVQPTSSNPIIPISVNLRFTSHPLL